ncbi:MAG: PD40 domain-containing protein [Verrucomicrobia bacterium]|nr:PD40 domain-containing protein [Verrucomicrobiota bacterium]
MNHRSFFKLSLCAALTVAGSFHVFAQAPEVLDVTKIYDQSKLIPLSVSGFTGEVDSTLKFDLEVGGCKLVKAEDARALVTGQNTADRTDGRLVEPVSKTVLLARAFSGGSARQQAHALANEILAALGRPGIALTRIAFKVDTGATSEIYVADYDGHNAAKLTQDSSIVAAPCWGRENRALYYTSYSKGPPYIFSHDIATGARAVVARYPGLCTSAAVTRDGRKLAMILSKDGRLDVYTSDTDGKNLKQVTRTAIGAASPCWSPDGSQICFSSEDGGTSALYLVSAGGGPMRRLRTIGVINATEPDWSPDGKTILFTTRRGGFELCTVPAEGGEVTALVPGEDPSWAPNSRTVVFTRRGRNESRFLSLLDVPTKQVKDVRKISGGNSQPSWAR